MSLRINQNIEAFNAHRALVSTNSKLQRAMERLASGYRVNRAADDAAGLAISEKLRSQIRGVAQAQRNIQDGVSLVQTAEGSLDEVHAMLQRMRELAVQYQNGTLSTSDKAAIQCEVDSLSAEITRIGNAAQFNGVSLLSSNTSVTFQIGPNDGETVAVSLTALASAVPATISLASSSVLSTIDLAIGAVSSQRAQFGAVQNRLEHAMTGLATYQENLAASESRIRDVDMASEMVNFTKLQILQQAGTSMLAQANQAPQSVLSLLR